MEENINTTCNHKYIAGYSFRMPQPFFRSLPCDNCGSRIRLTSLWRIIYWLVDILGFVLAYLISMSVHVKFLGSTLFVSIFIFIIFFQIFRMSNRLTLKYGKWVKADNK